MPFDYEEYQQKCDTLTTEQLQKEWENYTRQLAGGATSTATSVLFSPLTAGVSLLGLGLSAPRIQNARKKREIIEAELQRQGSTHLTRKRDVIAPMAVAGTLGTITLGLAGTGADMIAGEAAGHGIEYVVSHAALDATGAIFEHKHDQSHKKKAEEELEVRYQEFKRQYYQEHAAQGLDNQTHPQKLASPSQGLTPMSQEVTGEKASPQKPASSSQDNTPALNSELMDQILAAVSLDGSHPSPPSQIPPSLQAGRTIQAQKHHSISPAVDMNKTSSQYHFAQTTLNTQHQMPPSAYSPSVVLSGHLKAATMAEKEVVVETSTEVNEDDEGPDMRSHYPANCPSPFPMFSRPSVPQDTTVPPIAKIQTAQVIEESIMIAELPANEEVENKQETEPNEAFLTMEREITLLKAKILQMEIEKRQMLAQRPAVNQDPSPQRTAETAFSTQPISTGQQHNPPKLTLNTASAPSSTRPISAEQPRNPPKLTLNTASTPSSAQPISAEQPRNQPKLTLNTASTPYSDENQNSPPPPPLPPRSPAPPTAHQHQNPPTAPQYQNPPAAPQYQNPPAAPQYQNPPAAPQYQNPPTQHRHSLSSYPPPPPSPRPSMAPSRASSNSVSQPVSYPPPPPSPRPSMAPSRTSSNSISQPVSYPPPPPLATYHQEQPVLYNPSGHNLQQQAQTYAPPMASKPQHHSYDRQDSGYYSNPPSRHSSTFPMATLSSYDPSMHSLSPQTTGNQPAGYGYNPAQFGPVSPMSPHPQPAYFTPPPARPNPSGVAAAVSGAKDYINNRLSQYLPDIKKYVPAAGEEDPLCYPAHPSRGRQGADGWQWGTAPPPGGQPNYGR